MPDYRLDPNNKLRQRGTALPAQNRRVVNRPSLANINTYSGTQRAFTPGEPVLDYATQAIPRGNAGRSLGPTNLQQGMAALQNTINRNTAPQPPRNMVSEFSGLSQAGQRPAQDITAGLRNVYRNNGLLGAVGYLAGGAQHAGQSLYQGTVDATSRGIEGAVSMVNSAGNALQQGYQSGLGQPQGHTDSGVNAGQGAGVVVPQTQTQPQGQPSLAAGATTATPSLTMRPSARQAETQSMAALANYQAQPATPAFQRSISNGVTSYTTPQGTATFQGEPARAPGNFSGQLTDAAARKAAVTNLGLQDESQLTYDAFGNINNRAQALNSLADTMRQNRLQNRLGNHQFSQADQNAAFNELQGNQQAAAEQATLAQQQQQNDFQNSLAYRGMLRQEADTQSQIASRRQSAEQQKQEASAFSEKSLSRVAAEAAKSGLASPAQALFQYATSLGGLYNPKTGTVFTPSELQADAEQAGVPFEQYYQQLLANYQSLLGEA